VFTAEPEVSFNAMNISDTGEYEFVW